jgi:hypothetical protein
MKGSDKMAILSGYKQVKNYETRKNDESIDHILESFWTSSHTVEMDNGTMLQENVSIWNDKYTKEELDKKLSDISDSIDNIEKEKGSINGIATLDENGLVPANQIPGAYDNVDEGTATGVTKNEDTGSNTATGFILTGESSECVPKSDTIYIDTTTNIQYRWSGSIYVSTGSSLALGETQNSAYRGDRGKIAYDHSQVTGNPHSTTLSDLGIGKVENKSSDEIRNEITKENIVNALNYTPLDEEMFNDSSEKLNDALEEFDKISTEKVDYYDNLASNALSNIEDDLANVVTEAQKSADNIEKDLSDVSDSKKEIFDEIISDFQEKADEALDSEHVTQSVLRENGVHGLRIQNQCIQFLNNDKWENTMSELTGTTVFNSDGSITKTCIDGTSIETVFGSDGSITETYYDTNKKILKTIKTIFNADSSITEEIGNK